MFTLSIPSCSVRGPPASGPRPVTTFKAPLGSPAAVHISARSRQESGASSDGCKCKLGINISDTNSQIETILNIPLRL